MKLKKIDNAVVHCKTQEEAEELINGLEVKNHTKYHWIDYWENYGSSTCYRIENGKVLSYCDIHFYEIRDYEITEFSDLIEQEEKPVLTAEEAIEWLCKHYMDGLFVKVFGDDYSMTGLLDHMTPKEAVELIAQWKSEHEKPEKKEPEVEWYWEGTIYKKNGMDDYDTVAEYDTGCECKEKAEEYMADALKEYCLDNEGEYIAQVEHVCRVKKD